MSTTLIVIIVVAAVILLALLAVLPRMRASARQKQAERELHSRRSEAAEEHRGLAAERENRAATAEQTARRERAEANVQAERAAMHERGMADDELIDESERDRFQGVTDRTGEDAPTEGENVRGHEDERRFERERITEDVRDSERR